MTLKTLLAGLLLFLLSGTDVVRGQSLAGFIPEAEIRASVEGDSLHLDGGVGWLRSPRLFSDFTLEFEFRLLDPDTQAAVGFRSWPGYEGMGSPGYRIHLSEPHGTTVPLGQIETTGLDLKSVVLDHGVASVKPDVVGGWHRARLHVERASAGVSVDSQTISAVEELNEFTGYLTLSSTNGASEFRAFTVSPLPSWKEPFGTGAHRMSEAGIGPPRALQQAKPYYPKEPYAQGIQGIVRLDVVILEDGLPGDVRVTQSIHADLDEAAIACARKWRFTPGLKDGAPVPVIVTMEIAFKLADRPPQ